MGVLLWARARKRRDDEVQQRLRFAESAINPQTGDGRILRLWLDGQEATTVVPGLTDRGLIPGLRRLRLEAGWEASLTAVFFGLTAVLALLALGTYALTSSIAVAIMAPVGGLVIFWIITTQRISKRTAIFERQLIDALELAARSLRIGHPLVGSFRLIAEEIPAPVGILFAEVCQQQALGVPMETALRTVAEQNTSEDLKLFATSVIIQLTSGGNLADMMERLARVIRERQRLARRVKVLTAQTQFSKRVLLALPFLVFVVLNIINPKYMQPLYTTSSGQIILLVATIGLLFGWMTMNWLSKLTF